MHTSTERAQRGCCRPLVTGSRCQTLGHDPRGSVRTAKNGLVVDGEGWFILNARESRVWKGKGRLVTLYRAFKADEEIPVGININVLEPGEAMGMYHRNAQEAFVSCRQANVC